MLINKYKNDSSTRYKRFNSFKEIVLNELEENNRDNPALSRPRQRWHAEAVVRLTQVSLKTNAEGCSFGREALLRVRGGDERTQQECTSRGCVRNGGSGEVWARGCLVARRGGRAHPAALATAAAATTAAVDGPRARRESSRERRRPAADSHT